MNNNDLSQLIHQVEEYSLMKLMWNIKQYYNRLSTEIYLKFETLLCFEKKTLKKEMKKNKF